MTRWIIMLLLTLLVNFGAFYRMPIEQDVVASIERSRPREADLFRQLNQRGLFQNRLFIKVTDPALVREVSDALPGFGYELAPMGPNQLPEAAKLLQLWPYLPAAVQEKLLDPARVKARVTETLNALSLPSGTSFIRLLERDPLGLSRELLPLLGADKTSGDGGTFLIAMRQGPLDFDRVQKLYDFLKARDQGLLFLGGDFFALENKSAVERDIAVCSLVSLILGGVCFYLFSRQWKVLGLLLLGTMFSTALGFLAARWLNGVVYGLVLAFASTFFSFNNETLVHCAGLSPQQSRATWIGVASAIGTTVLGFLVLLFSASHMARQMAIISLASLAAFIVFILVFQKDVWQLQFRSLSIRRMSWKRGPTLLVTGILLLLIVLLPKPIYQTNLNDFRYTSSYLDRQIERFTAATARFDFRGLQAIPWTDQTRTDFKAMDQTLFHPLTWYQSDAQWATWKPRMENWLTALQKDLLDAGIRIQIPAVPDKALDAKAYLQLWNELTPMPWTLHSDGKDYLLVNTKTTALLPQAIPLHPKSFYEWILNDMAAQIGELFLIGLGLMLLYLIPWQRTAHKIALIFLPLLAAVLVLQLLFWWSGRTINIVHIMGASLVIAVALDYSSILISTEHDPADQGKVVLTGGLTLTSFGSLLLATHPLLKELGLIVFIGTGVAWVFALVCCRAEEKKA